MSHDPLGYYTPPVEDASTAQLRVVRKVRRVFGFIAVAAFVFAGFNSGDRNPLQWPATFAFMGCLGVYFVAVLVSWGAQGAAAMRKRSRRRDRAT
jgi:hypothetical protein